MRLITVCFLGLLVFYLNISVMPEDVIICPVFISVPYVIWLCAAQVTVVAEGEKEMKNLIGCSGLYSNLKAGFRNLLHAVGEIFCCVSVQTKVSKSSCMLKYIDCSENNVSCMFQWKIRVKKSSITLSDRENFQLWNAISHHSHHH